jgi:ABC-type protease/lipase transport system fused ATPase/permease subunit
LQVLPHGDATEVGEKGITLSGGQRQRVGICRAIYCDSDIVIFDDPLSALDAHVGKAVFQNVMQGSLAGRTRILVTHALHFLPFCDHILVMDNGRIAESGTYQDLMAANGEFARFAQEFGSKEGTQAGEKGEEEEAADEKKHKEASGVSGHLMTTEERNTGSVSGKGGRLANSVCYC